MHDYAAAARKQDTSINPVGGRLPVTPRGWEIAKIGPKGLGREENDQGWMWCVCVTA